MAKPRKINKEEVMMIPFLDILSSLIGILILIIVVLCVAQTRQTTGRTPEEEALSHKFAALNVQRKAAEKELTAASDQLTRLEAQQAAATKKETRLTELRKKLSMTAAEAKTNMEKAAQSQKQVEEMLLQIDAVVRQVPPIQKEIEDLKKELALRNKKPDEKALPVIVQPSGSGSGGNKKLFFVECSGGAITLRHGLTGKQNIGSANLQADAAYNDFLEKTKKTPGSMLIFLIRPDGHGAYNLAAGHAQAQYSLVTGKLPIPGEGPVDLSLFGKP